MVSLFIQPVADVPDLAITGKELFIFRTGSGMQIYAWRSSLAHPHFSGVPGTLSPGNPDALLSSTAR